MSYEISYKGDNSSRRAIGDWAAYMGLRQAKQLARLARGLDEPKTLRARWQWFNLGSAFAGVSGHPVREAFKHFAGITQEELEAIPD